MKFTKMHAASTCALLLRLLFLPASDLANECFAYFVCRRLVEYVTHRSQNNKAYFLRVTHYSSVNLGVKTISKKESNCVLQFLFSLRT
jgi:hypothetical protein